MRPYLEEVVGLLGQVLIEGRCHSQQRYENPVLDMTVHLSTCLLLRESQCKQYDRCDATEIGDASPHVPQALLSPTHLTVQSAGPLVDARYKSRTRKDSQQCYGNKNDDSRQGTNAPKVVLIGVRVNVSSRAISFPKSILIASGRNYSILISVLKPVSLSTIPATVP